MDEVTTELLERLQAWKDAGDRYCSIEFRRDATKTWVWIYDYSLSAGINITDKTVTADWDILILQTKRNDLRKELFAIEQKMGGDLVCTTVTQ